MGRMAGPRARILAAAALALALGAVEARADQIFILSGVTFDDGGTATGSFVTNDALDTLISANITTAGGTNPGFNYTFPPGTSVSFSSLPTILVLEPAGLTNILELTFTNPPGLTTTGAPILIGDNISFEQVPSGAHRNVTAGSVVNANAVPEPSSLVTGGVATGVLMVVASAGRKARA
jgi:hypothetical protein